MQMPAENVVPGRFNRLSGFLERFIPKLVLAPTFAASLIFVYGFVLWTAWISLTRSRLLPKYDLAGFYQYFKLFANDRWWVASKNLLVFGSLFIFSSSTGCIFQLRCPFVMDVCRTDKPPLRELKARHRIACHLYEQTEDGRIINVAASAGNS